MSPFLNMILDGISAIFEFLHNLMCLAAAYWWVLLILALIIAALI